jgi:hypothetical protein
MNSIQLLYFASCQSDQNHSERKLGTENTPQCINILVIEQEVVVEKFSSDTEIQNFLSQKQNDLIYQHNTKIESNVLKQSLKSKVYPPNWNDLDKRLPVVSLAALLYMCLE